MNFDRLAPFYQAMERLAAGGRLQRCRVAFLGAIPPPRRVLILGEGRGNFLAELRKRFPEASVVVVDASARMLEHAKRRAGETSAEFIHTDVLSWTPESGGFDLIVTHFFLDCLTADELDVLIPRLADWASPEAHWLLADFEIAPRGLARWRSRWIVALLYRFFRITCGLKADSLVAPDPKLASAGFRLAGRMTSEWGLLKSECWRRP